VLSRYHSVALPPPTTYCAGGNEDRRDCRAKSFARRSMVPDSPGSRSIGGPSSRKNSLSCLALPVESDRVQPVRCSCSCTDHPAGLPPVRLQDQIALRPRIILGCEGSCTNPSGWVDCQHGHQQNRRRSWQARRTIPLEGKGRCRSPQWQARRSAKKGQIKCASLCTPE
jgi:hypothetical protein